MVAQFKNNRWSEYGKLYQGRYAHASITAEGITMIIGGGTEFGVGSQT